MCTKVRRSRLVTVDRTAKTYLHAFSVGDFYIVSLWRSLAFWNVVVLTLGLPCGYLCEFAQRIDGLSVIAEAIGGKLPFFAGFRRIAGT